MAQGRALPPLMLTDGQRQQLQSMAGSRSLPAGLVQRARIILLAEQGKPNLAIARELDLHRVTVANWRKRFLNQGIEGLYDELRSGGPRSIEDEQIAELVKKTLQTKPEGVRIGAAAPSPPRPRSPSPRCSGSGRPLGYSRTARSTSSCPPTRSSWRRCATSWGCI